RDGHVTGVQTCALPISAASQYISSLCFPSVLRVLLKKLGNTCTPLLGLKRVWDSHTWSFRALRRWPQSSTARWPCYIISGTGAHWKVFSKSQTLTRSVQSPTGAQP